MIWRIAAALLLIGLAIGVYQSSPPDFTDYEVYRVAGQKAMNHRTVYDVEGIFQFKYAPVTTLFFAAFAGPFHKSTAQGLWWGVSLAVWILLFVLCLRFFLQGLSGPLREGILWATAAIFLVALRSELKLGQANGIAFLLSILGLFAAGKGPGGRILAGCLLALAVCFKLSFLVLVPLFLFRKDWLVFFSFGGAVVLWNLVPMGLYHGFSFSISEIGAWISTLAVSTGEIMTQWHNTSLSGLLRKAGVGSGATRILWAATGGLFAWGLWRFRCGDLRHLVSLALIGMLVWNPLVWPYWILMALPATLLTLAFVGPKLSDPAVGGGRKALLVMVCLLGGAIVFQHDSHFSILGGQLVLKAAFMGFLFWRLRSQERLATVPSAT